MHNPTVWKKSQLATNLTVGIFLIASSAAMANPTPHPSEVPREILLNLGPVGSDRSPIVVKTIVPEKSSEESFKESEKEAYEKGEKRDIDRDTVKYTKLTALVTSAMLGVAGLQALLFIWQLALMKNSIKEGTRASEAAETSANAAKRAGVAAEVGANAARESAEISRRAMIAGQRAYVQHSGIPYISHVDPGSGAVHWRFHPNWTNVGNTPTRGLRVTVKYELRDTPLPDDFPFEIAPTEIFSVSLPQHTSITTNIYGIDGEFLEQVKEGKKYLYIWGVASYRSVFDEAGEHITKFCVNVTNLTGYPILPWDKDKPFGITFALHGKRNCADEDCAL